MSHHRVDIEPRAALEIERAIGWWDERNPRRARLIEEELAGAYALLERFPWIGGLVQVRGKWAGILRHLILDRIGYHLYYEVDEGTGRVVVLCFRHEKQRPPRL